MGIDAHDDDGPPDKTFEASDKPTDIDEFATILISY
jgi:hypothetical protein